MKSIKDLEISDAIKPKLELMNLERDFIQKIVFITQKFEESELKAGKKPDYRKMKMKKSHKTSRGIVMSELKVSLDNLSSVLKKPKWNNWDRKQKMPKLIPVLSCVSCNFEQQFPAHCSRTMEFNDGNLICRKCEEKMSIPTCIECGQALSIEILELKSDRRVELD